MPAAFALLTLTFAAGCAATAHVDHTRLVEEAIEEPAPPRVSAPRIDPLVEIPFVPGEATLDGAARSALDRLGARLGDAHPVDAYLEVHGLCDPQDTGDGGRLLAHRRAESVRAYLHRAVRIPLDRIGVTALASAEPPAADPIARSSANELTGAVVVVLARPAEPLGDSAVAVAGIAGSGTD